MKKYFILLTFSIFLSLAVSAQNGITFTDKPWSEVLAQAEKENKLIFMDAYAVWCGPCKKMSKNVFTKEKVGDFYNAQFINVKMDMERGDGINLAKKYDVRAYPTLLFVDGKGEVVHRSLGYHNTDQILDLGSAAIDPTRQLASLDEMYGNGERSADFLMQYTFARYLVADGSHQGVAAEYLETQNDWSTEENLKFIYRFTENTDSKMFDYLAKNKSAFIEAFGDRAITSKIQNLVQASIYEQGGDPVENAKKVFPKVYPEKAEKMISNFKLGYYRGAEDAEKFVSSAKEHYSKYEPSGWDELNEMAWSFYELADKKKDLKQAVKWAKKSIELDNNYYNNDTLASLYYKMKKKKKAISAANNAILLAEAEGESAAETKELLERIKTL